MLCPPAAAISSALRASACPRTSPRSGSSGTVSGLGRRGDVRRQELPAGDVGDHGSEVRCRQDFDAGDGGGLGGVLRRDHEPQPSVRPGSLGDRENARNRPDLPVEGQLADESHPVETLRRDVPVGRQDRHRHGEVESGPALRKVGRGEVHDEVPSGEGKADLAKGRADPLAALPDGRVGQAHDREAGKARAERRLDDDRQGVEPDEGSAPGPRDGHTGAFSGR